MSNKINNKFTKLEGPKVCLGSLRVHIYFLLSNLRMEKNRVKLVWISNKINNKFTKYKNVRQLAVCVVGSRCWSHPLFIYFILLFVFLKGSIFLVIYNSFVLFLSKRKLQKAYDVVFFPNYLFPGRLEFFSVMRLSEIPLFLIFNWTSLILLGSYDYNILHPSSHISSNNFFEFFFETKESLDFCAIFNRKRIFCIISLQSRPISFISYLENPFGYGSERFR